MRPVRAERRGVDRTLMPFEGDEARRLAAQIPNPRGLVPDAVTTCVPSGLNDAE